MITTLLAILAASPAQDWVADSVTYKKCVEEFAVAQLSSGEAADVLMQSGEAECRGKWDNILADLRVEVLAYPEVKRAYRTMPQDQVDGAVRESVEKRANQVQSEVRSSVLRNLVFVKARIKEAEMTNAQD